MTPAKCPNPTCPFLFDPTQVPPGAVIACPRCGNRFTLAPAAPALPLYGATDDLGLREERPNTDDLPTEERPRPRKRRGKEQPEETTDAAESPRAAGSGAGKVILFSVIGVLAVCGVLAAILFLKSRQAPPDRTPVRSDEVVLEKYRLGYFPPAGNWEADDDLKRNFKASVMAVKSQAPTGWLVVDVKPLAYTPTDAELHDLVRDALAANFGDLKDKLDEEPATLGGVKGKRYTFESLFKQSGDDVKGEVYAVGHQRAAYLVYSFAPEKKVGEVAQAFVDFRARVRFVTPSPTGDQAGFRKVFRTKRGGYSLTATENLWKVAGDPSTQDEKADLWLEGAISVSGGDLAPDPATVLVLILDKDADPRAYLDEKVFAREGFKLDMKELTDDYQGDDPPAGPPVPTGTLTRYEVRYENGDANSRKFAAVATLDAGGKRHVAVGYAVLKQRKSWEKRLVQIVGSLAPPN